MSTTTEKAELDQYGSLAADQTPDEQLLVGYRQTGDHDLFTRLVHRYERELYSYLRRYLGNAEMAEDAFQATFLQVHLKADQFQEDRKFRPWLYTIATNQAIDAQRRNRRHKMVSLDRIGVGGNGEEVGKLVDLLVGREASPLSRLNAVERSEWVHQAVDQLPESLRGVVALVYYQGMKYREAADVLGIPTGTVKSRMHATVLRLHDIWNETHQEKR